MSTSVRCLPVGGKENPYQYLMMKGLRCAKLEVEFGTRGKWFASLWTALRFWPDTIHYDWIYRYFIRRKPFWTWLNAPVFVVEILFVRYVLRRNLVWTMHNIGTHDRSQDGVERWVRRIFARSCEWIRVFDSTTVDRAREWLGLPPEKFIVIPEGSYVGYHRNNVGKDRARHLLDLSPSNLVLCFVGTIRRYKGLDDLVSVFRDMAADHWRLVIAGDPADTEYADEIRQMSRDDNRILLQFEFIADDDLQIFLNAADVIVLPFRQIENSGSVILAMGFARAIITPRMGVAARRLSQQDELLYPPGHLGQALLTLRRVSDSFLYDAGQANYHRVLEHKWEDFGAAFLR